MLLTTQDQFEDQQITQTLGLVKGSTIRAKHLGSDILSVLRHMVGGELTEYTKMLAESTEIHHPSGSQPQRATCQPFVIDELPVRQIINSSYT